MMPGAAVAAGSRSTTFADRSLNSSNRSCFCCSSPIEATWVLTATSFSWACCQSPWAISACT
jgi:hypothetical protein